MIGADAKVLLHLLRGQSRRGSHAERLEAFYAPQADRYDAFRERLLHGREELIAGLAVAPRGSVVELGAGTGRNLEFFGDALGQLERLALVDLCPALLEKARQRTAGLANVEVIEADASTWRPKVPVDAVYLSYALTMMPDWRAAMDNACAMLRPGGTLGVVDFYVSGHAAGSGMCRHGVLTRYFWPRWFAHDGVRLDAAHLPELMRRMPEHRVQERLGRVPYLPGAKVPYYIFLGVKTG